MPHNKHSDEQTNQRGDPVVFNKIAYIPYLQDVSRVGSQKQKCWQFNFQGGSVELSLSQLDAVMIYGDAGSIPVALLSDASDCGTCLIFHTRHKKTPLTLNPAVKSDRRDLLGRQIKAKLSARKTLVIAKAFVTARIRQMGWLISGVDDQLADIRQADSLTTLRAIEASYSRLYWNKFFTTLGMPELSRRDDNPISSALDSLSAFTAPLILRWLIVHGLSPNHGYLHEPTNYDALVYDLMESVRHWAEQCVYGEVLEGGTENLTARATAKYKEVLESAVEVPSVQVSAKRKFVLYGMVLALREYLLGDSNHVHLPMDSLVRSKGRPVKVAYRIPGAIKRIR